MTLSLSDIQALCLKQKSRADHRVFRTLRRLGIGRGPPTRRGTRAGRLNRFWHGLTTRPAPSAPIASVPVSRNSVFIPPSVPPAVPVLSILNEVQQQVHTSMLQVPTNGGTGTGRRQTESSSSAMDKLHKPSPSHHSSKTPNKALSVCLLNSQSVNPVGKADLISDYIVQQNLDIMFITETWLLLVDDPKCKELTPVGYLFASFPRPAGVGGGIAVIYKLHLHPVSSLSDTLPYPHTTFEAVEMTVLTASSLSFLCIYALPLTAKIF